MKNKLLLFAALFAAGTTHLEAIFYLENRSGAEVKIKAYKANGDEAAAEKLSNRAGAYLQENAIEKVYIKITDSGKEDTFRSDDDNNGDPFRNNWYVTIVNKKPVMTQTDPDA